MRVHPHIPVGEIAAAMPHVAKLFDVFGVDYVMHGGLSLRDACSEAGVDPAVVKSAIDALPRDPDEGGGWADATLGQLVEELRDRRNTKLLAMMGDLAVLLAAAPPGEAGLAGLRDAFESLRAEAALHVAREERLLFPVVEQIEESWKRSRSVPPTFEGGIGEPIAVLVQEHYGLMQRVRRMQQAAAAIVDDDGMCSRLLDAVGELAQELRLHAHLENNVLFPRTLAIETAVRPGT